MKRILFAFRDNTSFENFFKHMCPLFRLFGVGSITISYIILAGNNETAGGFAVSAFNDSECDILIVGKCVTLPANCIGVTFTDNMNFGELLEAIGKVYKI